MEDGTIVFTIVSIVSTVIPGCSILENSRIIDILTVAWLSDFEELLTEYEALRLNHRCV